MEMTANESRRKLFERHRELLPYDDKTIAKKLKMSERRFTAYVTGQRPITLAFVSKFYNEFVDEIIALLKQQPIMNGDIDDFEALSLSEQVGALYRVNTVLQISLDTAREDMNKLVVRVNQLTQTLGRYEHVLREKGYWPVEEKKTEK
jgi:hypothetical protein